MAGRFRIAILLLGLVMAAGCHRHHIEATVVNRTGAGIRLLEVDYPSSGFGANALTPGEKLRSHMDLRGRGPVRIQYVIGSGDPVSIEGPELREGQQGRFGIELLPGGKAEFHPVLTPAS